MVDLQTLFYGALIGLGTIVGLKIVDMVLEFGLNKTVFSKVWYLASKNFKKFLTRLKPIRIRFEFSARVENNEIGKVKAVLNSVSESISSRQQTQFSQLSWTDNNVDNVGFVRIQCNKREFRLSMAVNTYECDSASDFGGECITAETFAEDICFCIETDFAFYQLEQMLLDLSALVNSVRDDLKESILIIQFSKGKFTMEPLKREISIDEWIRKKEFEVSVVLKSHDKVIISLQKKRVEVVFPSLRIDEKVSEYLREVLLNYYL
jgi:hypothetical protein